MLSICLCASIFWACIPFTGWTEYTVDRSKLYCTVKMEMETLAQGSFVIVMIVCLSLIPAAVLTFLNFKTVRKVSLCSNNEEFN